MNYNSLMEGWGGSVERDKKFVANSVKCVKFTPKKIPYALNK